MSLFHFRGEFIAQQDGCARYRFQTDYVDDPKRIGVFTVCVTPRAPEREQGSDWQWLPGGPRPVGQAAVVQRHQGTLPVLDLYGP